MIDRPYFHETTAALAERADQDWRDPVTLHTLYVELLHRERKNARILRETIEGHLKTFKQYFAWPSTNAPESQDSLDDTVFQVKTGLLSFLGYHVGQSGISPQQRRALLEDVYLRQVPLVQSATYMAEWGKPRTASRLKKLANVLATNVRNAKRNKSTTLAIAISEWEADLAYLKKKFYVGVYSFKWPNTAA